MARSKGRTQTFEIDCPRCDVTLEFQGAEGDAFFCEDCGLDLEVEGGEVVYADSPSASNDAPAGEGERRIPCPHCGSRAGLTLNMKRLGVAGENALIAAGIGVVSGVGGVTLVALSPVALLTAAAGGAVLSHSAVHNTIKLWRSRQKAKKEAGPWAKCSACGKGVTVWQALLSRAEGGATGEIEDLADELGEDLV